jgi:MerR family transcriptional regulator, thiopeptide resistance regulator
MRHRVHDFAELTGVTIKALQHYDRIGLLTPVRTAAGHRIYVSRDQARLAHIVALKRVGIPLKQMKLVLDGGDEAVREALIRQQQALDDKRADLARVMRAIRDVQPAVATSSEVSTVDRLTNALEMHDGFAAARKYFSPEAWARWGHHYEDWPTPRWRELFREVESCLHLDPSSDRAEALLSKWLRLWHEDVGDGPIEFAIRDGIGKWWADRHNWPDPVKERVLDVKLVAVLAFLGRTSMSIFNRKGPMYFNAFRNRTRSVA